MLAKIYQPSKTAMQSGKSNAQDWVMEFESEAAKKIEPLMGWTGASDMRSTELRLRFASREAAIDYADAHGITYQIIEPRRSRRVLKAYSDNFRSDRTAPWTH
ncbi:MAG: ETC complex I subunit [Alphaproteobacteria bacterium]|nr:ETC complex I subunit [Alphaproteobacteria bacterium]